jgi:hypothetical protein
VSVAGKDFHFTSLKWRERVALDDTVNIDILRRDILQTTRLRERARVLLRELGESQSVQDSYRLRGDTADLQRIVAGEPTRPNCIFFATNRSVVERSAPSTSKAAGGIAAAYAAGLVSRPWQLRQFAAWMRAQAALAKERPVAGHHLEALRAAAERFLPSYVGLRPDNTGSELLIDRHGSTLRVSQLSDGERGVLAMVLDLARRLSQANPDLADPLKGGSAVVMIDEIDLHLHPEWQRQIVRRLTEVFPKCQFIATTHSPQVIGEVEHERIQIIADGEVFSPTHSFGVDSSRVLEEIMEVPRRTADVQQVLDDLSEQVANRNWVEARRLVTTLEEQLGESDAEVIRARMLLEFLGEDE